MVAAAESDEALPRCRFCSTPLRQTFVDLGMSPLCERFLAPHQLDDMEPFYPLHVRICESCFLVQLPEYVSPESIFEEYAYFSSYSDTLVAHARTYVDETIETLRLSTQSFVVEVASNDGYLLHRFVEKGVPALGIEPARNVAEVAVARGVPTLVTFFGEDTARRLTGERGRADLIIGNNVLSQAPHINDFVSGLKLLLAPAGVITVEFPHLLQLLEQTLLDTIYHEHFSYFSLRAARRIFAKHGLTVFDLEEVATHGGSLRLWLRHDGHRARPVSDAVAAFAAREEAAGLETLAPYRSFRLRAEERKRQILDFLIKAKRDGKVVAGYGAPGKGNTLLNFCGIRTDFIGYTVDRNPYKHGRFLPGTHIPVFHPGKIVETRPDYLFILPWNLRDEIVEQLDYARRWGARFVVPLPELEVIA